MLRLGKSVGAKNRLVVARGLQERGKEWEWFKVSVREDTSSGIVLLMMLYNFGSVLDLLNCNFKMAYMVHFICIPPQFKKYLICGAHVSLFGNVN